MDDPYKILGIDKDASPEEIRRAYRRKAAKFHPDNDGEAWVFQQVQDAYDKLTGKKKKERQAKGKSATSESNPNSKKGSSPDSATHDKQRSNRGFEKENPNPASSFGSSSKQAKKRSHRRKVANRKVLFTAIGIVGGLLSALFAAWLIIGSQWFDAARTAFNKTQSVERSPVQDPNMKQTPVATILAKPTDPLLKQAQTTKRRQDQEGINSEQDAEANASNRKLEQANAGNKDLGPQDASDSSESSFNSEKSSQSSPLQSKKPNVETTFADATIVKTKFVPIKVDHPVFYFDAKSTIPKSQWSKIPSTFQNWEYSQLPKHHGKSLIEINSSGVVFLLVYKDWGQGGAPGKWQQELTTEEEFAKDGWEKVMNSVAQGANQGSSTTVEFEYTHPTGEIKYFELWKKQFEAGEKLSLRTHKYVAPMIIRPNKLSADIETTFADATIAKTKFVPIKVDHPVFYFDAKSTIPKSQWSKIPSTFQNWEYSQLPKHHGKSLIEINSSGVVFLLVYKDWGQGGAPGKWQQELTTEEEFAKDGWEKVATPTDINGERGSTKRVQFEYTHTSGEIKYFELWKKQFEAGEKLGLRTHKYVAPMIIRPIATVDGD